MNALSGPSDAELVARFLQADREAFATVYDRYGPRLYDFAYSMLRHREDAADAVADSFVTFAEKLPQLREPDRLRPWMYAITRSECLRRLKARKRISYGDDEQLIAMPDASLSPEAEAERAALQALVWDAAAGLADRDRALLDLHLRQGLEGAELGEAMGVTAANAYVMLNRLRTQVDRSLGALLIARLGRDECETLDDLLVDWDGTFSPLIRKRVARHVEQCEVCGERRKKILSPWMLLAGVPVFAAPVALRDRVLNDTQLVAYAGPPASTTATGWTKGRSAAAAAVAVIVVGGAVTFWPDGETTNPPLTAATPTPTASASTSPTPSATAPATTSDSTPTADAITTAPPTPSATAQTVALSTSTRSIALGSTGTRATLRLTNTGDLPASYTVRSRDSWLTVTPGSGTLGLGGTDRIGVRADRGAVREGRSSGRFVIAWDGGSTTVSVTLTEEQAPVVGRPTAADPTCANQTVTARASVSDESGLRSVRLHWSGPAPNGSHTATMRRSGSQWTAQMGPFTFGGTVTFKVVATDTRGNTTTGPTQTVDATPCPG